MLKRIFVSLMNDKINGWEMSFLQRIQKIIEYTEDESVPITLKRYYRLEQIFEKTNVYTEDIKDLSWEDIKGKYKDL